MKNLSLVLNIILLVAVGVLYYLHFFGSKAESFSYNPSDTTAVSLKIAYINADTVLKHYDYLDFNRQQIETKQKKMEQDYRNRAMGLQSEISAYQRNVNSLTLGQARATEEDLTKKQQNLQLYQQSLSQQLMDEETKLTRELYGRITKFLEKYGQERGLQVVLKFDPTSDLLYGGKALDISQDVIKGLNEGYQAEKSNAKIKADSLSGK
jgi:outer membrane protein